MNIQTVGVNEQEVSEYKNCFNCEFLKLNQKGNMSCHRRESEGVIFEMIDIYMTCLPCSARDAEIWDEEMDENGEFRVDDELGYGYQEYLRNKGI